MTDTPYSPHHQRRLQAALAGLLHDIGKLEQRSLSDSQSRPQNQDQNHLPVHAAWTAHFASQYVPKQFQPIVHVGALHHQNDHSEAANPDLARLVSLADKLSTGEPADVPNSTLLPQQLITIFDQITVDGIGPRQTPNYLPLQKLALAETALFPGGAQPNDVNRNAYANLRDILRSAASYATEDIGIYLENLLAAMQHATWNIPTATYQGLPDISLFDHSRMTAALAACMSGFDTQTVQTLLHAVNSQFEGNASAAEAAALSTPVATLIGGDISGIQKFIYNISSKRAAKMLRGRSLYLQLLTEVVLKTLLDTLALPATNVIYSGGGHFFLLAPPEIDAEKLQTLQVKISKKLHAAHGTQLYLALGHAQVDAASLRPGAFPERWNAMHRSLGLAKNRRYSELTDADLFTTVFAVPPTGGNPKATCSICGNDQRDLVTTKDDDDADIQNCTLCHSFAEDLGKDLTSTRFISFAPCTPTSSTATAKEILATFGFDVTLQGRFPVGSTAPLWALEDVAIPKGGRYPLLRYTVNNVPERTFDQLAQEKVEGGLKRLGVLRADVDDLGRVFQSGLGQRATLARLATLSFQMSLFFEGWIKAICQEDRYKDAIYSVYAGGDDLFLIGPWHLMPELAQRISADFRRYTAQHPAFHLSAGLSFIGGKYPVYQAADDAEEAVDQAKNVAGKAAFSFLDQPWKWHEFSAVAEKHATLVEMLSANDAEKKAPRAILQTLQTLYLHQKEATTEQEKLVWGPWHWQGAYQLTRTAERASTDLRPKIEAIRNSLSENNYANLDQWGAAARWTQLRLRKEHAE